MGPQEFMWIAIVGFVIFGAKKLPEMARSLGSSVVEFKKAINGEEEKKAETAKAEAAAEKA
ncbi:MAG: twin-arginine translocase TatA/TatE family subunit [Armatimonadetes bacterium]|nr:twin-arginine translocase TatA/TatE family subunit [Armatimonadota bacterium]